jgi:acyl-CoA thioesterase-1
VRFSALRTLVKWLCAWALCVGSMLIAVHDASAASDRSILVLGDSLSAAYGIKPAQGWVALLQKRLQDEGYGQRVVNASVSGETSSGGLQRLPRALQLHKPGIVIIELGSNDGLRGLPLSVTRDNLSKMVAASKKAGAEVVLVGMQMPPNYGARYTAEFAALFRELASRNSLALVPFLLESVALNDKLMQADGLHPNVSGQPIILDNVWPHLEPLLKKKS